MPDKPTFVVNDRRKFTAEGELRPDLPPREEPQPAKGDPAPRPQLVSDQAPGASLAELADLPESDALGALNTTDEGTPGQDQTPSPGALEEFANDGTLPPGPTPDQAAEAQRAYEATAERLDTAMRAANPGGEHMPPMNFERLVQSLYTQALLLLGGGAQPGETPRVDILGAKETIDMLSVLANKSRGNLEVNEDRLLQSALFDLHMGFLEITQALARQAAQRGAGPGSPGGGGMPPMGGAGPRIVR